MPQRRTVFFVSDGTGITAQMLGHSLLTQFEGVEFNQVTLPFVDSVDKAEECLARIERESLRGDGRPIVFSTLVNGDVRDSRAQGQCAVRGFLRDLHRPAGGGLGVKSSHTIGRSHSATDKQEYKQRIEAINFAMAHDDGASHRELEQGRRHPGRRVAQRQDADQPLPGAAVRRQGGELPADPRGFRAHAAARRRCAPHKAQALRPDHRAGAAARDPPASAGPTASTPTSTTAATRSTQAEKLMRREGIRWHQLHRQVDRGNRHHHPARAQDRAARVLSTAAYFVEADRRRRAATFSDSASAGRSDRHLAAQRCAAAPALTPCPSAPKIQPTRSRQIGFRRAAAAARHGADRPCRRSRDRRGKVGVSLDRQREMRAHRRRAAPSATRRRRSPVEHARAHAERRGAAQDGADVAGVLDASRNTQVALGGIWPPHPRNLDLRGDAGGRRGVDDPAEQRSRESARLDAPAAARAPRSPRCRAGFAERGA